MRGDLGEDFQYRYRAEHDLFSWQKRTTYDRSIEFEIVEERDQLGLEKTEGWLVGWVEVGEFVQPKDVVETSRYQLFCYLSKLKCDPEKAKTHWN